jgi:hypothetical protein
VCESAEDLFSADPVLGEVDLRWRGVSLSRCELAEGPVRPRGVVVPHVLDQHPAHMMLIDDQQPVQELGAGWPLFSLPAGWTDVAPADPFVVIAGGAHYHFAPRCPSGDQEPQTVT